MAQAALAKYVVVLFTVIVPPKPSGTLVVVGMTISARVWPGVASSGEPSPVKRGEP